ncbi:leucine-rich repeat-containing protein 4B-like isoform X1 [Penaeus chinensis]|uniref:leucine-rich repeat-containing protein 4B-like isoform X1 n=1 Tax=Penaeus chinensis TaxID=139456 RepID=UPI001FB699A3|nr:leucine-rich repeat-containing protein 4B-like isoform X1 [Penaeus chinensis]XP_047477034.1 leucine-rich repeat-containing protein 4B-like isoform X1 [Penaeus chinensis]XP_047477035.1 leucine-rich repeat-containing protein 4B-like isoform X1 [Penaeus chinensis]XP_047477036.1 leucine-rich repeat-containing protein 4B-like isoform X1 [Penaeus chinensis]XP_047477037.1 leucine-rich repeat-containing protein 4B-like isoform X1 [Penaeus chinensis]XP_047477038.1 leucine-rich repeat-containing prot
MGVYGRLTSAGGGVPNDEEDTAHLLSPSSLSSPSPCPSSAPPSPPPSSCYVARRRRGSPLMTRVLMLSLWLILLVTQQAGVDARAAAGNIERISLGETARTITCPSATEIHPCACRVMKKGKEPGLDIVCDHADEKHVRNALDVLKKRPFTIFWMKFRNCKLQRIADYVFLGLDVRHLNIIRSNVSAIERSSLSALGSTIEALDLANNNIREVPTPALAMLKMLTFLNLNYNQIQVLNEGAFAGLSSLERLSLYENKIQHIHNNAFKDIGRKLMRLNLGKNNLDDIPTDAFHPLINLEVLDLHENRIRHIPDNAFQGLTKLDMLKLEHNLITTIQDNVFSDLSVLNSLNIEHNHIENVSDRAFAGLESNLEWLEMGNNRLDHIPSHALRPLHNLRQLDLDANKITEVKEDAFKGYGDTIKYILLDKNRITHIPPLAFVDLHSLEWLKLSHNEISTLTEDTVQPILDTVTMIDVSKNPLICNCDLLWLRRWVSNPNNKDPAEEMECVTTDQKSHSIKNLPIEEFNCPLHLTTSVAPLTQATPQITSTSRHKPSDQTYTGRTTKQPSPSSAAMLACSPVLTAVAIASTLL